jgi:outer membrane protein assembly factor BamE (lipoprotein component of BamABCDE complex)
MKIIQQLLLICAAEALLVVFWAYTHSESYCFLYPSIDTRYAPGYSESAFSQVSRGMTDEAVERLIGKPLATTKRSDGAMRWLYTEDGKALFGDWAWLGREVVFREGKVIEVLRSIYYD